MHTAIFQSVLAFTQGADTLAQAMGIRLQRARGRAFVATSQRGHVLGPWTPVTVCQADESARCTRCARTVVITLGNDPVLSGSALTEGCLSAAEGSQ